MNNVIYFFLLVTLSNVCYSSSTNDAVKARRTRSLIMDYNWPEPDPSIKKYPHERNCHYYYQEEMKDIFTLRKCHEGEIFDYHKHECTQKSNGQCFSDRYGKTTVHEHIHSKFRKLFKCPTSDGNFPDIFDCRKYFHCTNGKPKHRRCHSNKHFDKWRRHCVDRKNALCADITDVAHVNQKDYKCPRPHGLFADPKVCSMYYECLHRKPFIKICQTGQLFDSTKKRCDAKEQVNCGAKINPYENTAFVLSSTHRSTLSEAETSTETSSVFEETHPKKETVKTIVTVSELLGTASKGFLNTSTSSLLNQPEKSTTSELQHESTETDSKKKTSLLLSSIHYSTVSEAETSTETSSLRGETHLGKEAVKTTITVNELSSTGSNISGNIPSSSSSSQPKKSTSVEPAHESTETDSKSKSTSVSSRDIHHTEYAVVTKSVPIDNSTTLPCPPETCIQDGGLQLRCPKANGVYPYNKDNSRFIQCDNFKIYIRPCLRHQVFDVKQNACILVLSIVKNVV